jgi:hypothetical protein
MKDSSAQEMPSDMQAGDISHHESLDFYLLVRKRFSI